MHFKERQIGREKQYLQFWPANSYQARRGGRERGKKRGGEGEREGKRERRERERERERERALACLRYFVLHRAAAQQAHKSMLTNHNTTCLRGQPSFSSPTGNTPLCLSFSKTE